jgi:hypothetical protein
MSVGVGAASIFWFCCRKPSVCQAKNPAASNSGVLHRLPSHNRPGGITVGILDGNEILNTQRFIGGERH